MQTLHALFINRSIQNLNDVSNFYSTCLGIILGPLCKICLFEPAVVLQSGRSQYILAREENKNSEPGVGKAWDMLMEWQKNSVGSRFRN